MPEARGLHCRPAVSRHERQVRQLAIALTAAAAAATLAALALSPTWPRAALAAGSLLALAYTVCLGRKTLLPTIIVGSDGQLRAERDGEEVPVVVRYCGARFISLRSPQGSLALWPDSLGAGQWRRLLVACRWPHAGASARQLDAARDAN